MTAIVVATPAVAPAARLPIPDRQGVIHACYAPGSGEVRIVPATNSCRSGERPLHWSVTGPPGRNGLNGKQAPNGDNVPGWVTVATTIGAALAGGIIGAAGAILGPVFADKHVARREQAREMKARNSALKLIDEEVTTNLATVKILSTEAFASQARDIEDSEFNAQRDTLARYLDPEDLASFEELYAQFRMLREDRAAGDDISGALPILADNGRKRLELIHELLRAKAEGHA